MFGHALVPRSPARLSELRLPFQSRARRARVSADEQFEVYTDLATLLAASDEELDWHRDRTARDAG
jgi:hypothetical protein